MPLDAARVPDLWYDLYARLLPGTAFVAAFNWLVLDNQFDPSIGETAVFLGTGYLAGMAAQPIGATLAHRIEERIDKDKEVERTKRGLGRDSRPSMILSKMHGEITFYCQVTVLAFVLLVAFSVNVWVVPNWNYDPNFAIVVGGFFVIVYCVMSAISFARRQLKRAKKYQEDLGAAAKPTESPQGVPSPNAAPESPEPSRDAIRAELPALTNTPATTYSNSPARFDKPS